MQNKSNKVLSLAMSAALMLTNMISPMKVYADEAIEPATDAYVDDALPDEIIPETEAPFFSITLPYYDDIVYMVDEGRVFHPEGEQPEDKDIILRYQAMEKVEFAFTAYNDVTVTKIRLMDNRKDE